MSNLINEKTLINCLEHMRAVLRGFDAKTAGNIIFLNLESFYGYINKTRVTGNLTDCPFEKIAGLVEPYIPLAVTEDDMADYISAALDNRIADLTELEDEFVRVSMIKFINAVRNSDSDEDWNSLKETCVTIRNCKEQGYGL